MGQYIYTKISDVNFTEFHTNKNAFAKIMTNFTTYIIVLYSLTTCYRQGKTLPQGEGVLWKHDAFKRMYGTHYFIIYTLKE